MTRYLTCLIMAAAALPLAAQAPDPANLQQLTAASKDIQAQQAQIAANQTKMEEKLATIGEDLRLSRYLTGRD